MLLNVQDQDMQRFGVTEFCSTNWDCAIHGFWSSINSIVSTGADAAGAFFFTAAASPFAGASSDAAGGPAGAAATLRRGLSQCAGRQLSRAGRRNALGHRRALAGALSHASVVVGACPSAATASAVG